jgi:hypothetical protein
MRLRREYMYLHAIFLGFFVFPNVMIYDTCTLLGTSKDASDSKDLLTDTVWKINFPRVLKEDTWRVIFEDIRGPLYWDDFLFQSHERGTIWKRGWEKGRNIEERTRKEKSKGVKYIKPAESKDTYQKRVRKEEKLTHYLGKRLIFWDDGKKGSFQSKVQILCTCFKFLEGFLKIISPGKRIFFPWELDRVELSMQLGYNSCAGSANSIIEISVMSMLLKSFSQVGSSLFESFFKISIALFKIIWQLSNLSNIYTVAEKKTWPVREKNQFLSHKSYSNVTIILCISISIIIFSSFPIIFWYFRQVHWHRFFFSLLTAFAIQTDNPEIHKCRSFFAKAKPLFTVDFDIFSW